MGRRCDEPEAVSVRVVEDAVIRWVRSLFSGVPFGVRGDVKRNEKITRSPCLVSSHLSVLPALMKLGHENVGDVHVRLKLLSTPRPGWINRQSQVLSLTISLWFFWVLE